jgi:SNF2 family DNA or RNA helicase
MKHVEQKSVTNIISKSKYNTKIYDKDIFTPGFNIIDRLSSQSYKPLNKKNNNHRYVTNDVSVHLNADFSKVDHVPGLKTTLYQHQQTAVKSMLDLEFKRSFTQTLHKNIINEITYKIAYNVAVLSEPVGSGKTIDILAVICLSKIPRAVPDIMELKTPKSNHSIGFVRCKFKKFLKPTLIFVGGSVMKQWEYAIKLFTNLKVFSVNSVIELKILFDMISNKTVNDFDIILVKNGKITVPIQLPNNIKLENKNKISQPYIYNLIANLREYCWARVVIDDFDTIRLPHNAGIVRGIFTWYISSTRKSMEIRTNTRKDYQLASDWLIYHDYGCANIMYNNFLFSKLNVRNDINYLKSTTQMPCPKFHVALFKNPNDRFISLLTSMDDSEVNHITEMLNGDAIGTAAEAAGIKTNSIADIFSRILGNKFEQYKFAGALMEFIDYQQSNEDERISIKNNPDPNDTYGKKDLLDFRDIEYKYVGIKPLLIDTHKEYKEVKDNSGLAIQRVKDNIKHGTCPVCRMDLEESNEIIIVKCCNAVFCGNCGITAQKLNDKYNKLQNGTCSNCRSTLTIKDLLYIGDDLSLDDIEEENFSDEELDDEVIDKIKGQSKKNRSKYTAIIDVINGESIPEDIRVDLHIPNMMKGANYLREACTRKVLIFANFDETLNKVINELEENNIKYWHLAGGINEISKTSIAFTECIEKCALVINSTKHCSGLNLQTATDLIFAHTMHDQSVESQVAGRGHRLGRTSPLNIWYFSYENEYNELQISHSVRELTKSELVYENKMEDGLEHAVLTTVQDNTNDCFLDKKK